MICKHHGSLFHMNVSLFFLLKKYFVRDSMLKLALLPCLNLSCITLLEKIKLVFPSLGKAIHI